MALLKSFQDGRTGQLDKNHLLNEFHADATRTRQSEPTLSEVVNRILASGGIGWSERAIASRATQTVK
jgi:hypothetical protein